MPYLNKPIDIIMNIDADYFSIDQRNPISGYVYQKPSTVFQYYPTMIFAFSIRVSLTIIYTIDYAHPVDA